MPNSTRSWLDPQPIAIPDELRAAVGGHPLVAQTLARRGILTPAAARAFLDPAYAPLVPPEALPGMAATVERLAAAIQQREATCVWGDFDVDGQTATTILVQTLRDLGAAVSFHIPVRSRESHGVNLAALKQVLDDGASLVLTCDTGVSAHEAVSYARQRGVDFLITDHHELPPTLPEALAVVNPRRLAADDPGADHPLLSLPGAGVAYKLAEALYACFDRAGEAEKHTDLAALGIVADLALLTGEARTLVQRGLIALRSPQRLGIKAILESAELNPAWLTESHIGFSLGPRLNALGRLADANLSVELFTTQDLSRARVLAVTLEGLNFRRRMLTQQVFQAAQAQIEANPALLDEAALVLAHPTWPAGVIGIVASRLVEYYRRPVILLSTPPGELGRGSARSVEGVNITAAIAAHKDVLAGFGGHPMAAGLSLEVERLPEFRRRVIQSVQEMTAAAQRVEGQGETLRIDAELTLPEVSLELIEDVRRLAPFGSGNPALVFIARNLAVKSHTLIGRSSEHRQVIVEDAQGHTRKVLWWQGADWELPQARFDLAFTLEASDYRGQREATIQWIEARPIQATMLTAPAARKTLTVVDYRAHSHPLALLKPLATDQSLQVWCEADAKGKLAQAGVAGRHRLELTQGEALAIWSSPPDPHTLQTVLQTVHPSTIYLFAVEPDTDRLEAFIRRLAGLVKYALQQRQGQVSLPLLAAACGQLSVTVRQGLAWMAASGHCAVLDEQGDGLRLGPPAGHNEAQAHRLGEILRQLLAESQAYRAYYASVDQERLVEGQENRRQ